MSKRFQTGTMKYSPARVSGWTGMVSGGALFPRTPASRRCGGARRVGESWRSAGNIRGVTAAKSARGCSRQAPAMSADCGSLTVGASDLAHGNPGFCTPAVTHPDLAVVLIYRLSLSRIVVIGLQNA